MENCFSKSFIFDIIVGPSCSKGRGILFCNFPFVYYTERLVQVSSPSGLLSVVVIKRVFPEIH